MEEEEKSDGSDYFAQENSTKEDLKKDLERVERDFSTNFSYSTTDSFSIPDKNSPLYQKQSSLFSSFHTFNRTFQSPTIEFQVRKNSDLSNPCLLMDW